MASARTRISLFTPAARLAATLLATATVFATSTATAQGVAPGPVPTQGPTTGTAVPPHPLTGAVQMAEEGRAAAEAMKDYRVLFSKREMVGGTMFASQIDMKFRRQPLSVYLRFVNPEHAGREVLFVDGQNGGQMLAHDVGVRALIGTVAIDPNGSTALAEARHPITQIGVANLADSVIEQWKAEMAFGECDVKYYPDAKLGEQEVIVIESSHPVPRRQFPFQMTRLWLDKATHIPVRVQQYEWPRAAGVPPVLVEEYTYTNLQPNPGLTDADFHPKNPNYHF